MPLTPFLTAQTSADDDERVALFISNMGWPGARVGSLKLIRHQKSGQQAVFDLAADEGESRNVVDDVAYRDGVARLESVLDAALDRGAPELPSFKSE